VFALTLALNKVGEKLWKRIGVEPSGDPFNSLVQLEFEKGIPRNPFINSGALVVCDILISRSKDPKEELLTFVRKLANTNDIHFNKIVITSEKKYGFTNAAHVNLMKSFGNIKNNIDLVLDLYYHMCSIEMTCEELSRSFLLFANDGLMPFNNEQIISLSISKRINATMQLCGLYDEAGQFAFKVGLPGKSGVGGGIIAICPDQYCISTWSPKLNHKGNSIKGFKVLEDFTTITESSIF
jgi:glutaminase